MIPIAQMAQSIVDHVKQDSPAVKIIDWAAIGAVVGVFFTDIVPVIAAFFSAIWLGIQIFVFIEKRAKGKK